MLEVGCGVGAVLAVLGQEFPDVRLHGVDIEWKQLAYARGHLERAGVEATWSPDGRRIASERCRSQGAQFDCFLYVMRSDGTRRGRLFRSEDPVWSPNGQELAFLGRDARRRHTDAIIRARLDGSGRRILFGRTPACGCGALDWGPPPRHGRR